MRNFIKLKKKFSKVILTVATVAILSAAGGGAAAYKAETLIPMGNAVGINLMSDGIMVIGVPEILADGVTESPAYGAGLTAGDIITRIGKQAVTSKEEMKTAIDGLDGSAVDLTVKRGNNVMEFSLTPHKSEDGHCELGLWMRDGVAGIGTMTFYDPDTGIFGALGHSVNDVESGALIPLRTGTVTRSVVTDVVQGKAGLPGQLHGTFNMDNILGTLTANSSCGIFGKMSENDMLKGKKTMPAANDGEIKTGPAVILSNVSGTDVKEYDVEITRLYTGAEAIGRSMMLRVTDEDLIAQTGGIVQGMSGSPIIQDGKIIGAVTHVLVNDPTRGYGISIGKMLEMIDETQLKSNDNAA